MSKPQSFKFTSDAHSVVKYLGTPFCGDPKTSFVESELVQPATAQSNTAPAVEYICSFARTSTRPLLHAFFCADVHQTLFLEAEDGEDDPATAHYRIHAALQGREGLEKYTGETRFATHGCRPYGGPSGPWWPGDHDCEYCLVDAALCECEQCLSWPSFFVVDDNQSGLMHVLCLDCKRNVGSST